MRLIGEPANMPAEGRVVERGELGEAGRRELRARQERPLRGARANLFQGQTARQSSQP